MTNIIEFWQYYDFLFPEQSLPYVLITGLFLSLIISPEKVSILNLARHSKISVLNNRYLRTLYGKYQGIFTYFWIIILSTFSASLIYLLLKWGAAISVWFALFLQTFLAWQAFPIKRYALPIMQARSIFREEGTMLGLAHLRVNMDNVIEQNAIIEMYRLTLREYLFQITIYWLIPFVILFVGYWPFVFFYLAFIIQYKKFGLQNRIVDLILSILHTIVNAIMRFLIMFCRGSTFEKNKYKDIFLNYNMIFWSNNLFLQKVNLDSHDKNKNYYNNEIDSVGGDDIRAEFQEINLNFINYSEILTLGSMTIIAALALLIFYLRAII